MTDATLTPADLQAYIDRSHIDARLITGIGDTPTVPTAAAALGVERDQIVKSLLFLLDLPHTPKDAPQALLVISHGERRVDKKMLAPHFGVSAKRVRLALPETVIEVLGYVAGGVPPFGHRREVPVLVDASVLTLRERFGGRVYAGGGDECTVTELTVDELLRVTRPQIAAVSAEPGAA